MGFLWTKPEREDRLRQAVRNATSLAGVCRELGLAPVGGNHETVKFHIARLDLDISHHKLLLGGARSNSPWSNGYDLSLRRRKSQFKSGRGDESMVVNSSKTYPPAVQWCKKSKHA